MRIFAGGYGRMGIGVALAAVAASMAKVSASITSLGAAARGALPMQPPSAPRRTGKRRPKRNPAGVYVPHSAPREAARHAARGSRGFVPIRIAPAGPGHDFPPPGLTGDDLEAWTKARERRRDQRRWDIAGVLLDQENAGLRNRHTERVIRRTHMLHARHVRSYTMTIDGHPVGHL